MEHKLDNLFQEWVCLGGSVLIAKKEQLKIIRTPEEIIAESTTYCRNSGRLTWIIIDWLICHIEQINTQKLIQESLKQGNLSVLGLLCNIAYLKKIHPKFKHIMNICKPHSQIEPFFYRTAQSKLASKLAEEEGLEVFRKWNYLCRELRYL